MNATADVDALLFNIEEDCSAEYDIFKEDDQDDIHQDTFFTKEDEVSRLMMEVTIMSQENARRQQKIQHLQKMLMRQQQRNDKQRRCGESLNDLQSIMAERMPIRRENLYSTAVKKAYGSQNSFIQPFHTLLESQKTRVGTTIYVPTKSRNQASTHRHFGLMTNNVGFRYADEEADI